MALCPSCGEDNPERARFCLGCGAPLGSTTPAAQEERKVVSILFVDLVGFTARSHEADPEDVRAALAPYHRLLKKEIERFGGTVEKFIGDAVMAVFGAPIAHEDDAERAVRAALRITEELVNLNATTPAVDLSIRAAVNTGEGLVVLGARPEAGEGMVTGDVVNTASRLQNAAPVDGVVVGELTYRTTKDVIDFEELPPVSVKGKPAPIPVWRALAAKSRFGVDTEMRPVTAFVGRDHEMELLQTTFRRTVDGSSVQLVTIVGEPGVGKTRILSEFAGFVDDQEEFVTWRQGRSLPYGEGITFWALGEIVKAQSGILESDTPEVASEKLQASIHSLFENGSERQWFQSRLSPLVGIEPISGAVEREESFTAWRRFLEAVASKDPLVLVFEDLHWADQAMLDFVEHLVDWSTGVAVLVICTARPELYERTQGWGGGKRNSNTVSLSPLTATETSNLVASLLGQAVLPDNLRDALLEKSGGNPLYAEEFIRMLGDQGMFDAGGPTSISPADRIRLPDTVQAVIAARLDTLPAERKALLHDASIVGKVFWAGAVAAIGGTEDGRVRGGLHELLRKEIVRPARNSSIEGEDEYSFWHGLIRDVSYSQIPRAARARKHEAMARWLEKFVGERAADHADILAYHYRQALDLAIASGLREEAERLQEPTRHFLVLAGDRAMALDMVRAKSFYKEALELYRAEEPERTDVLFKLAEVLGATGAPSEGESACREAIEGFLRAGLEPAAAAAMLELARSVGNRGDGHQCFELERRAIDLLEAQPPSSELGLAYGQHAISLSITDDPREGLKLADKSITVVEAFDLSRAAVTAQRARGIALLLLGDPAARESFERALEMADALGIADLVAACYSDLGGLVEAEEGPSQALKLYAKKLEYARTRGVVSQVNFAKSESAAASFSSGSWDEALELSGAIIATARAQEDLLDLAIGLLARIQVLTYRGQVFDHPEQLEEMVAVARALEELQITAPALAVAAWAHHVAGDEVAARTLANEFKDLTKDAAFWRPHYLLEPMRVLVASGDIEAAHELLRGLEPMFQRDRNNVLVGRALLAEAEGEFEDALRSFEESAERWKAFGVPLEEGQAFFGAGRCLAALGRHDEAKSLFHGAKGIFVDLGAVTLLKEVADSLGQ
jgi:class 3 adenylate cyclase/tetratricopeptide (TPR) repeat protein